MEKLEQLFIKGFNAGYLLSEHEPKLLDNILNNTNKKSIFLVGIKLGKMEFDNEILKNRMDNLDRLKDQKRIRDGELDL